MTDANPWGLTPAEIRTMRDVITHGSGARAARARLMSAETVIEHIGKARKKMPKIKRRPPTLVQMVATFAVWEAGQ